MVMKCSKCFWYDNQRICPICDHKIPIDKKHIKEAFVRYNKIKKNKFHIYIAQFLHIYIINRCYDCGAMKHEKINKSKTTLYTPHENQED